MRWSGRSVVAQSYYVAMAWWSGHWSAEAAVDRRGSAQGWLRCQIKGMPGILSVRARGERGSDHGRDPCTRGNRISARLCVIPGLGWSF